MIKKTVLALSFASLLVSASAFAKPTVPATINAEGHGLPTAGSFSQTFDLVATAGPSHLITVGAIADLFDNSSGKGLSFSFNGSLPVIASVDGGSLSGSYNFGTLSAGNYTLVVNGLSKTISASYVVTASGFSSVTPSAPVPEPASYAMLLAGLGVMATIARRRARAQA